MDDPEADADDTELGTRSPQEVDRTERALGNAADDAVPAPHRGPVAAPDIRGATTASHPSEIRHDARRRRTHNVRFITRLELARERRIAAQVARLIIPLGQPTAGAADSDWDYVLANSSDSPPQCAGSAARIGGFRVAIAGGV
jgi:hypothetical protein